MPPADYGDFLLYSHEKLDRTINGVVGQGGRLTGGLGKDASAKAIIAEYDKLGGAIKTKDGRKVETGTFYDFENGKPRENISLKFVESNKKGLQIREENVGDEEPKKGRGRKNKIEEE